MRAPVPAHVSGIAPETIWCCGALPAARTRRYLTPGRAFRGPFPAFVSELLAPAPSGGRRSPRSHPGRSAGSTTARAPTPPPWPRRGSRSWPSECGSGIRLELSPNFKNLSRACIRLGQRGLTREQDGGGKGCELYRRDDHLPPPYGSFFGVAFDNCVLVSPSPFKNASIRLLSKHAAILPSESNLKSVTIQKVLTAVQAGTTPGKTPVFENTRSIHYSRPVQLLCELEHLLFPQNQRIESVD